MCIVVVLVFAQCVMFLQINYKIDDTISMKNVIKLN
jgi:hypothetical protein